MNAVKEADKSSNPHRFWSLLKGLSGKRMSQYAEQLIHELRHSHRLRAEIGSVHGKSTTIQFLGPHSLKTLRRGAPVNLSRW